jgi:hypothetical protein
MSVLPEDESWFGHGKARRRENRWTRVYHGPDAGRDRREESVMATLRLRDGREIDVQVEEINGEVRIPVVVRKGTTIAIDAVEKG